MISQKIGKNKIGKHTMGIHGHTKLVFIDKFGRETVKMDQDNTVTVAVKKIFESNYFGSIDYSLLMPAIKKVLGGVVLFQNTLGNDASDIWIPKSFDNEITAHAGQTVPTSLADDLTRGIPNTAASIAVQNGYKLVWNFPETQGNGTIASVGLCHSDFGDYALKNEAFKPIEMISNDSIKSVTWAENDERYKILNVYDSVNHYGYTLVTNQASVGRNGQSMGGGNFAEFTVKRRKNQLLNNISVDMSHYLGNVENEETFTLRIDFGMGGVTNYGLPSIFIDNTNNLFWIGFGYGTNSLTGNKSFSAYAYDMTAFTEGATLDPVKEQSISGMVAIGSNMPLQGMIKEGAEGYIPAIYVDSNLKYNFGLVSYDTSTKEFTKENISGYEFGTYNVGQRFSELIAVGNYYFVRGAIQDEFVKLFEVDRTNNTINDYGVSSSGIPTISPYFIEPDNPIIGATQWGYSPVKFTMGNSGTAINKLYLATKNDLPASITKSASTAMRVEYTITYI